MKDIEGFHILWTAPYFEKSKDDTYSMQDYELLTMILSALMWRKMNGPITLYGDARAIDYVEGQGLSHIWNGGIKEIQVPDSISPGVFWAAGKLYALGGAYAGGHGGSGPYSVEESRGIHSGDGYLCNTQRRNISGCISRQGLLQYGQFVQL